MSSNIYIQSGTQYYPGLFDTNNYLTLAEADFRFIKKGTDVNYSVIAASTRIELESTSSTTITNTSNCDEFGLHLHSILSGSTGVKSGCAISFNQSLSDTTALAMIALDKIADNNGNLVFGVRNGATCDIRLRISSTAITFNGSSLLSQSSADSRYLQLTGGSITGNLSISGTIAASNLFTQTLADARYLQLTGGNLSGNLGIGDALPGTLPSDISIFESSATPQISMGRLNTDGNNFIIGYTHIGNGNVLNRLFIQPMGATVNDTITFTVNGGRVGIGSPTPTQKFEVNGNINVSSGNGYMIAGTSIDGRYVRTGAASTMTSQLYINGSVATAVPACRRYGVSGSDPTDVGGGTVSVSLRTSNDLWCAGNMYSSSDRRLKHDFRIAYNDQWEKLLDIEPYFYKWKTDDPNNNFSFGFIAQDLINNGLYDLVKTMENNNIIEDCIESDTPKGYGHTIMYDRIPLILTKIAKKQRDRINELENRLIELEEELLLIKNILR
jgi:hypothetical protein